MKLPHFCALALFLLPTLLPAQSKKAADLPFDKLPFAGLAPEEAARQMQVPPGFSVKLFAGEPEVHQPIAMALDARGRVWVAEAYTYPRRAEEGQGKDRIVVFEDTDGDGRQDKRTVFAEGLNLVSGMEVGFGGVFVGAAPYLLFIPMEDGDTPKATGAPQVLLDGFGFQDTHETLNTFTWGPDGWLYGCHGVFTQSRVGRPGVPEEGRTKLNGGVWRYHPTRRTFEVFAEGASNPWGVDFDDRGQAFITACVIPHLFHIIQGAHYHRQAGQHFSPYVFEDIRTCADHLHYASATPHAGNGRSDAAGGGHAHCGAMIYLGDAWPAQYRGALFMNNIHGARLNMDTLERKGSGFVGHHGQDFLLARDAWSQILNLRYGPDGQAYMIDWYDKQACHTSKPEAHDRTNGRIFKVTYGPEKPAPKVNLAALPSAELVRLQLAPNEWYVRTARRLLQERGPEAATHQALRELLRTQTESPRQLRALWALHVTGGLDEALGLELLRHPNEDVRAWTLQLLFETGAATPAVRAEVAKMAAAESSPVVRLYLAAAAQRIPAADRWEVAAGLLGKAADAMDANLPLMAWWATEPLVAEDAPRALALALQSPLPKQLRFASRRTAALRTPAAFAALGAALRQSKGEAQSLAILQGMNDAMLPGTPAAMPAGWEDLSQELFTQPGLRDLVLAVGVKFGSPAARATLRQQVADAAAPTGSRLAALEALAAEKDAALPPVLCKLLHTAPLRGPALRALARYDNPETPGAILACYAELPPLERKDALMTLASRATYARPLLAAATAGTVPRQDFTAELVRQIRQFHEEALNTQLDTFWGTVRENPAEKQQEIARYRAIYQAGGSTPGEPRRGRAIFTRTCAQCHTLYEQGGRIGPNLTGSNRSNLDYLLENIVTPNAVIPNDYRAVIVEMKDGRVIFGTVRQQDATNLTLNTMTEAAALLKTEIKSQQTSEVSMMPEGLLSGLSDQEVRDLFVYLRAPSQVPLPE